jgi:hypothetical protein
MSRNGPKNGLDRIKNARRESSSIEEIVISLRSLLELWPVRKALQN